MGVEVDEIERVKLATRRQFDERDRADNDNVDRLLEDEEVMIIYP